MGKIKKFLGRFFYGSLFCIALPSLLILWTCYTEKFISLPVPQNIYWGYALLLSGLFFVITAMGNLWFTGKGLPMNAYPPKYFVKTGIYSFTKNPIYLGTILISFGVAIISKSSSGFWLVSPMLTLMITAYLAGFENEKTEKVFDLQNYKPFLSLPEKTDSRTSLKDKIASCLLAFVPWLIVYEAFVYIGKPIDAIPSNLPFEDNWPVFEFSFLLYGSIYLYAFLVPFIIKSKKNLRQFVVDSWFATFISGLIFFALPVIVNQRPFTPHSFAGELLVFDRQIDSESAAFPSFHVIWAGMAAWYFTLSKPSLKLLWYGLAILISISCITTGNHSIIDVVAGVAIWLLIIYKINIWNFIRSHSEKIANSWREWRWGKVRIINHGAYAGLAAFGATLIAGSISGEQYSAACFITCIFGITGACLWAQYIEGSPKLLRPFGYYGGVIGVMAGCMLAMILFDLNFLLFLGAFAMAAPWVQISGRLRCLVQGCCHGKPCDEKAGIHFNHSLSRVNSISGLKGVALHPTQLYSIATNVIIILILMRLYNLGMPSSFITGIYFMLNGMGRFVEESYRGEVQTAYWSGMRIYQWIAILNIILGAVFTTIPGQPLPHFQMNIQSFYWGIAAGIFAFAAYGVDFPLSNRRFARLTGN